MTPAFRWAAMRAIFNVSLVVRETRSQDSVHRPQLLKEKKKKKKKRAEAELNRSPSAY